MNKLEFRAFQAASNSYLCEQVPSEWQEMTEAEQNDWIENNKWEGVENYSNDEVFGLIEDHAATIFDEVKHTLEQVKKTIIDRTIECKMDSDVNSWDMIELALSGTGIMIEDSLQKTL